MVRNFEEEGWQEGGRGENTFVNFGRFIWGEDRKKGLGRK